MATNFTDDDLQLIDLALREDIGSGDVTSEYFVGENDQASARVIAKERAIVAGAEVAAEVFRRVDAGLRIEIVQQDGATVAGGTGGARSPRPRAFDSHRRAGRAQFSPASERDRDADASVRRDGRS